MMGQRRSPVVRIDGDGVRRAETTRGRWLGALVAVALATPVVMTILTVSALRLSAPRPVTADDGLAERAPAVVAPARSAAVPVDDDRSRDAGPHPREVAAAAPAAATPVRVRRRQTRGPQPDRARPGPDIDAADAIEWLRAQGETGGIAAFGLPGTDPPKPGVIVPEDFVLPEGFVRHYQTTDDGEELAPILTVHPDYDLVDADGEVVATPPGRVVPPELAPPGLPIEILEVPERRTKTSPDFLP